MYQRVPVFIVVDEYTVQYTPSSVHFGVDKFSFNKDPFGGEEEELVRKAEVKVETSYDEVPDSKSVPYISAHATCLGI